MENKRSYYAVIPANVRYDRSIPAAAKLLYGEISALCNQDGRCRAENSYFENLYEVSSRTVQTWINALVTAGYVYREFVPTADGKATTKRYLSIVDMPSNFVGVRKNLHGGNEEIFAEDTKNFSPLYMNNTNEYNSMNKREDETRLSAFLREIIDYLNAKIGAAYKYNSRKTQSCIKARLSEGFTLDDFKKVIDKKVADWLQNREMARFLRPETLFGPKFESYVNEPVVTSSGQAKQTGGWIGTMGEIDYGKD